MRRLSQRRTAVKPMDKTSGAILALKPVTFHYKRDSADSPQFGPAAEEVAEVNPHLVVRDENGAIYSVRYDAVNAMLLNEFLKEHKKVQNLEATVAQQQKGTEALTTQVNQQNMLIQKISPQLQLQTPPATSVANNQ